MEEAIATRYWCHMCNQRVDPIMEVEIKCPFCQSGFVEEMTSGTRDNQEAEFGSDRALSLWAPILLGMVGNPHRRRRHGRTEENNDDADGEGHHGMGGDNELNHLESILRRRRRSSATILQLLQGIQAGMASESENSGGGRDRDRDSERERVILINPFNQTIIVQGSYDSTNGQSQNQTPVGSLGDYFIGPGLDLLLQHLSENDPNRYGTPPAQKDAIEALPTVAIKNTLQCSVCLDDFEIGTTAKEMPCKHKFHSGCILPWLELHSSCPVCRYQLPADESKLDSERSRSSSSQRESGNENPSHESSVGGGVAEGEGRIASGRRFSFPWPFSGLFSSSSSSSQSGGNSSSSTSPSSPANAHAPGSASQRDEN